MCWLFWVVWCCFQTSLDCSCCFTLFSFVFGSAKLAALIQVVLVLSVVFVCSGMIFTIFSCLKLRKHGVFDVPRQFGCLWLFHVVSNCSSCFCSIQVVGRFSFFYDDVVCCIFVMMDSFINLCSLCCAVVFWFV